MYPGETLSCSQSLALEGDTREGADGCQHLGYGHSIHPYPLEGSGAISTTSQQSSPGPRPDLWEGHTVTGREVVNM